MNSQSQLKRTVREFLITVFIVAGCGQANSAAPNVSGYLEAEIRWFPEDAEYQGQSNFFVSAAIEPEIYWSDDGGTHTARMKAFYRQTDAENGNRTHGDIRELFYRFTESFWQVDFGINQVFWGVTESVHLVDIINQTDNVESISGDVKLGQPMIAFGIEKEWGNLDIYLLPLFRERSFSSGNERFQFGNPLTGNLIDWRENNTLWESGRENKHLDFAVRWAQYIGNLDFAVSYFGGTNRAPIIVPSDVLLVSNPSDSTFILVPLSLASYYQQTDQMGLEMQFLINNWALKFEGAHQRLNTGNVSSIATGFEYTFSDLSPWGQDIGLLMEYLWNDSKDVDTGFLLELVDLPVGAKNQSFIVDAEFLSPFENDIFLGMRFALNDVDSTNFLAGVICDLSSDSTVASLEGSTRIGDAVRVGLNAYFFSTDSINSAFFFYRKDDVIELKVDWYF